MSHQEHTICVAYREIPRYIGYRFGSDGTFWSRWNRRGVLTDCWTKRDGCIGQHGYVFVYPKDADLGRIKTVRLSRLILEAFKGPCPDGLEARHFPDRDPANNRIENLSWSKHIDNVADKVVHGTLLTGTKHPMHKLTDEQVAEIRERYAAGATSSELGLIYGVNKRTITWVAYGDTWKDLPGSPLVPRPKVRRPNAKLTRPQVDEIRRLRAIGMRCVAIAPLFGVSKGNIAAICRGEIWVD